TALYVETAGVLSPAILLGAPAPDGNGFFDRFGGSDPASLRPDRGAVAAWVHLTGTTGGSVDDDGVFSDVPPAAAVQVARGRRAAPGAGSEQEFTEPAINAAGTVA